MVEVENMQESILNINIGGTKSWQKIDPAIQKQWKIMDVSGHPDYRYDLNSLQPFPIETNSVSNYYSSHTLEHIHKDALIFVLKEIERTLKPNGLIRVVVPDVTIAMEKYLQGNLAWMISFAVRGHATDFYPDTILGKLLPYFYSTTKGGGKGRTGHLTVFDKETLIWYFTKTGFKDIQIKNYHEKSDIFNNLDFKRYKGISIYLEARC